MFEHLAKPSEVEGDFRKVRAGEGEEVWKRRDVVAGGRKPGETRNPIPPDLVGVALSGGGVRAASVGLGLLQRLHRFGLLKFTDYLSTVSGGGYIGTAYSTSVALAKRPPEERYFPLDSDPTAVEVETCSADEGADNPDTDRVRSSNQRGGGGMSTSIIRMIYNGNYLFRPWEAANKYLIGAFFNNLLMLSGVVALSTMLVLIWRTFDHTAIRDFLDLLGLDNDIYVAFFPFALFTCCWLAAWMVSYWKYDAEAPGRWAQRWLYGAAAALLIGIVMLLVNEHTSLGVFDIFFGDTTMQTDDLGKWMLGLVGAGLLPLLKPDLIKRGLDPRSAWDKISIWLAGTSFLVGVPLVVIGLLGQQGVAGTDTDYNGIRPGDVYSWPAFCALVDPQHIGLYLDTDGGPVTKPHVKQLSSPDRDKLEGLRCLQRVGPLNVESMKELLRLGHDQLTFQADGLAGDLRARDRLKARLNAHYATPWQRLALIVGWFVMDDNPAKESFDLKRRLAAEETDFCALFNDTILAHAGLANALLGDERPKLVQLLRNPNSAEEEPLKLPKVSDLIGWFDKRHGQPDPRLVELIADAGLSSRTDWYAMDRREVNREILLATHPECFYTPEKTYRWNVVEADQSYRWTIFWISASVFTLALFVDLNSTSLHRFYRNRLAYAFLPGQRRGRPDRRLSSLCTTDYGAPYQLINASINLSRARFLDQVDEESATFDAEHRSVQNFLFSHLFCGSKATGWARTRSYECFLDDNISVADAMALSGAAVDTMRLDSLPLTLLGLALNVNIGQWLPNPKYSKPAFKSRAWRLLVDVHRPVADSGFCRISDGGFTDNLGIVALLKRRCRLIIALDAGCDPHHRMADLAQAIRTVRIHDGIRIRQFRSSSSADELDTRDLRCDQDGFCTKHHLIAQIEYPETDPAGETEKGVLIYVKSSLTGDEGVDLLEQRARDAHFPHQKTSDQFYSAQEMECYRQLGFHMADEITPLLGRLCPGAPNLWASRRLDLHSMEQSALRGADESHTPADETDKPAPNGAATQNLAPTA